MEPNMNRKFDKITINISHPVASFYASIMSLAILNESNHPTWPSPDVPPLVRNKKRK